MYSQLTFLGGMAHARSVTTVGGTTHIPEVAAGFSGGGFSDIVRFTLFVLVV
jgi:hypothetical protein